MTSANRVPPRPARDSVPLGPDTVTVLGPARATETCSGTGEGLDWEVKSEQHRQAVTETVSEGGQQLTAIQQGPRCHGARFADYLHRKRAARGGNTGSEKPPRWAV